MELGVDTVAGPDGSGMRSAGHSLWIDDNREMECTIQSKRSQRCSTWANALVHRGSNGFGTNDWYCRADGYIGFQLPALFRAPDRRSTQNFAINKFMYQKSIQRLIHKHLMLFFDSKIAFLIVQAVHSGTSKSIQLQADPICKSSNQRAGRNGQNPCPHNITCYAPTHRTGTLC